MNQFLLLPSFKFMRSPVGLLLADRQGLVWLEDKLGQISSGVTNDAVTIGDGVPFSSDGLTLNIVPGEVTLANEARFVSAKRIIWTLGSQPLFNVKEKLRGLISGPPAAHTYVDLKGDSIRQIVVSEGEYSAFHIAKMRSSQILEAGDEYSIAGQT